MEKYKLTKVIKKSSVNYFCDDGILCQQRDELDKKNIPNITMHSIIMTSKSNGRSEMRKIACAGVY